jgi:uncharacterized membrane protein
MRRRKTMMGKRHCLLLLLGCAALMMTSQLVAQTIRYEYESFEVPGAVRTAAFKISPQGDVAGRYLTGTDSCNSSFHSFVWKDGAFEYFDFPGAYSTAAHGINALGEVTGRFYDAPDPECSVPPARGFVRTKGGEFLEITLPDAVELTVNKITASGMMLVDYLDADCWPWDFSAGCEHGYLLKRGSSYQIDYPGSTWTDARSINEKGDIVGGYADSGDRGHGFLLKNGEFSTVDYPGAEGTEINDINPAGEMVGIAWSVDQGRNVSFLLRAGKFIEIQFPDAVQTNVWGLNAAGTVCGFWKAADGIWRSFVAKRH